MTTISYTKQFAICESLRKTMRQTLSRSHDLELRKRANDIPTADSILRAASLLPVRDSEESLEAFAVEHVLGSLRLTAVQREGLNLSGPERENPSH